MFSIQLSVIPNKVIRVGQQALVSGVITEKSFLGDLLLNTIEHPFSVIIYLKNN